jgi:peptide/nickel transport system substrate-binding protein
MNIRNRGASRAGRFVALLAVLAMASTACSGGSGKDAGKQNDTDSLPATSLDTLRVAWAYQDGPLDPATFFGGPGFSPMAAMYEGLVQYEVGSTKIVPQLATKWTISPDGLTYTFTLRQGVKFHDGTTVDADAFKYSFQRFIDVGGAPGAGLVDVSSFDAPSPDTFVIQLKKPNIDFLAVLASFCGPKAMSPTLVKANTGSDKAARFLNSHDAGTGPYALTNMVQDKSLTLTAAPGYWGDAPTIKTVEIKIIPDITTQVLSLRKGDVDMVTAQVPPNLQKSLKSDADIHQTIFGTPLKSLIWIKDQGIFKDLDARKALAQAINREVVAKGAYGEAATASKSMLPAVSQGGDVENDNPAYDPKALADIVKDAGTVKPIVIGYYESLSQDGLAAELIQTQLAAAGLKVSVRSYGSEFFGFPTDQSKAPDLMVLRTNGDPTASSWLSTYYMHGGPLTLNAASVPDGDAALNAGIAETDAAKSAKDFEDASNAYAKSGWFITLADCPAVLYSRDAVGPVAFTQANPFGPDYPHTGSAVTP